MITSPFRGLNVKTSKCTCFLESSFLKSVSFKHKRHLRTLSFVYWPQPVTGETRSFVLSRVFVSKDNICLYPWKETTHALMDLAHYCKVMYNIVHLDVISTYFKKNQHNSLPCVLFILTFYLKVILYIFLNFIGMVVALIIKDPLS